MATNVFNKSSWVTMEGLDNLLNGLHVAPYFDTSFAADFQKEFAVGASITVPLPFLPTTRTTLTYNAQAMVRPTTTLTLDQIRGGDLEWDSLEKALDMERGEQRAYKLYVKPVIDQIRQDIDSYCAQFAYQNANMLVGALGTNPTTIDGTSGAALEALQEMGVNPEGDDDIAIIIPPVVARAVKNSALGYFAPVSDIGKQYRTGLMGKSDSQTWYNSMSLWQHTAGTWQTPSAVTVNGASQTGSSLAINCTSGDTFKKGDKFKIASVNAVNLMTKRAFGVAKTFTITADVTATGATATLPIYPPIAGPGNTRQNVDALPANAALLTLFPGTSSPNGKVGMVGLSLTDRAFLLGGVKLELPQAVEAKSQSRDDETGLAIRFVRQWDNRLSTMTNRLDTVFGCGVGLAEQCSVAILCG